MLVGAESLTPCSHYRAVHTEAEFAWLGSSIPGSFSHILRGPQMSQRQRLYGHMYLEHTSKAMRHLETRAYVQQCQVDELCSTKTLKLPPAAAQYRI